MVTRMKIALVLVAILAVLPENIVAVDYVVGDSTGWRIPPGGPAFYANWTSGKTFKVGDILVFNFATGAHDVAIVTKSAYDSCSATGPVTLITVGPANITLNSTGTEYFICTFGQHCNAGQKLAINVTSSATTPSPAPSPATSPAPSPVPNPTRAPTPSPTPSTRAPTPSPTPTTPPSPSPSSGPSGQSPSPSGGEGTSPSSAPPPGPVTPGTTSPPPITPSDGQVPPPAPSSAPRGIFAPALIMFMSIAVSIMW